MGEPTRMDSALIRELLGYIRPHRSAELSAVPFCIGLVVRFPEAHLAGKPCISQVYLYHLG